MNKIDKKKVNKVDKNKINKLNKDKVNKNTILLILFWTKYFGNKYFFSNNPK